MKKRVVQLITGLATAGMLAATGFVGAQTSGKVMPAKTIETVEYKMEENEAPQLSKTTCLDIFRNIGGIGLITKYISFNDLIDGYRSSDCEFAIVHSVGYSGNILVCNDREKFRGYNVVSFFTKKKDQNVKYAGSLCSDREIRYKDGVIYAGLKSSDSYETYAIVPDGTLMHKDYAARGYTAYTTLSNNASSCQEIIYVQMVYDELEKQYNKAKKINYGITKY